MSRSTLTYSEVTEAPRERYNGQQVTEVQAIPPELLQRVLACLPQQLRLGTCSSVSRSVYAAAVAATAEIHVRSTFRGLLHKADVLCAWLHKQHSHMHMLRTLVVEEDFQHQEEELQLQLPWQCLQQLQRLVINGRFTLVDASMMNINQVQQAGASVLAAAGQGTVPEAAAAPPLPSPAEAAAAAGLSSLTALTSLELRCCAIGGCTCRGDAITWLCSQLQLLTQLRSLQLHGVQAAAASYWEGRHNTDVSSTDSEAFGAVLAQLTELTCLQLGALHVSSAALAAATRLRQLHRLELAGFEDYKQPLLLELLPSGITHMSLSTCFISCEDLASCQLSDLRHLTLDFGCGGAFCTPALACMPALEHLDVEAAWDDSVSLQQLLAALPQLMRLQHLELDGPWDWLDVAASCNALVSSSQLTSLVLWHTRQLPLGFLGSIVRSAQQLQRLTISCKSYVTESLDAHDWADQEHNKIVQQNCISVSADDLALLGSYCSALLELSILWAGDAVSSSDLQQLLQLTRLTKLGVGGNAWDDGAAAAVLAHITSLQALDVLCAERLSLKGLACLASLTRLTQLYVGGCGGFGGECCEGYGTMLRPRGDEYPKCIEFTCTEGKPPDVWRQLRQSCDTWALKMPPATPRPAAANTVRSVTWLEELGDKAQWVATEKCCFM